MKIFLNSLKYGVYDKLEIQDWSDSKTSQVYLTITDVVGDTYKSILVNKTELEKSLKVI